MGIRDLFRKEEAYGASYVGAVIAGMALDVEATGKSWSRRVDGGISRYVDMLTDSGLDDEQLLRRVKEEVVYLRLFLTEKSLDSVKATSPDLSDILYKAWVFYVFDIAEKAQIPISRETFSNRIVEYHAIWEACIREAEQEEGSRANPVYLLGRRFIEDVCEGEPGLTSLAAGAATNALLLGFVKAARQFKVNSE